ncbi:glycogen synthase GlgA [Swaminathania salitolerans]|uniref:Glycogen synthase n=1 Tax=Swaminathania salitolerans TaxID=182838 RepID=A0A511BL96_9PROT|nr:glycogen synthase GlgA [Swaminathania salitolerans]GBQ09973.1 glycogen/starch synthase [Swaminathania salitolerans LMG 21291]GEL01117.1 glycogen synthase 2 [Swaminathania salitolerans]
MPSEQIVMLPTDLHLLSVAAEMFPFVKTGGLGDVAASLPNALRHHGVRTRTLLPGYPAVLSAMTDRTEAHVFEDMLGYRVTLWEGIAQGHHLYAIEVPELYERAGGPYLGPDGRDWPDNDMRFAVLSRVAACIAQGCLARGSTAGWRPDAVMTHDWQAGLVAAYLHYDDNPGDRPAPPVAHVIHNMAFQGLFPREILSRIGLPDRAFTMEGVEYYGKIGYMKAALQLADRLITVSPTYAEEIQTPENGMGLEGLLQARSSVLTGILNGIDIQDWNPMTDRAVIFPYPIGDIAGRRANKRVFQAEFGLPQTADTMLLGIVSRLTRQKGVDLLADIAPRLFQSNIQLAVVGVGDADIMQRLRGLQLAYPRNLVCHLRYDETLGHRLHSAVDASLIPSRFEPCGLTQLHALRYGSVPIAARVGGLTDTIVHANTAAIEEGVANGVLFSPTEGDALYRAIRQAQRLFQQRSVWARLQRNGSLHDVSWHGKAGHYARLLYRMAGRSAGKGDFDEGMAPRLSDTGSGTAPASPLARTARMPQSRPRNPGLGRTDFPRFGTHA